MIPRTQGDGLPTSSEGPEREDAGEETSVSRIPRPPQEPSEREKQEHETRGHVVFRKLVRALCGRKGAHASARGRWRRRAAGCRRQPRLPRQVSPENDAPLVAKDRRAQMLAGTAVESKGRDDYSTSFMTRFILSLGWKRLVFRSDW